MIKLNLPVHSIAHARAGDKGDVSNISLIAYLDSGWSIIEKLATKEKILEKPLFGHGIFSSRVIGDQHKIINNQNKMLSAIPLHPHNSILQVWLELGFIGIILFYIFLYKIINKIYEIKKINPKYAAFSLVSLFQIFLI